MKTSTAFGYDANPVGSMLFCLVRLPMLPYLGNGIAVYKSRNKEDKMKTENSKQFAYWNIFQVKNIHRIRFHKFKMKKKNERIILNVAQKYALDRTAMMVTSLMNYVR